MKIGFISLGCTKNRVDTEIMMGLIKKMGHQLVPAIEQAEAVIINTCGFISEAQEEAIDTILETGRLKRDGHLKYLMAAGCLTQRFGKQVFDEIPELDGIWGLLDPTALEGIISRVMDGERVMSLQPAPQEFIEKGRRVISTPPGSAYLKIVEGCDNRCAYCSIPSIKGPFRSRPLEELAGEAEGLAAQGIKEIVLVGQDTALYGKDIYGEARLKDLLVRLNRIEGLEWIRMMYLHPAHVDTELIEALSSTGKVIPYLEIPIQHASSRILTAMGRGHDQNHLRLLFKKIRSLVPGVVLRTTVMVGFPGESKNDFGDLLEFIGEIEFDWLGAFAFQPQEGTPAITMPGHVAEEIKLERRERVMALQKLISRKKNIARINRVEDILVSSQASKGLFLGRGVFQGPEVDGMSIVKSDKILKKGNIYQVRLKAVRDFDMIGEIVHESAQ